MNSKLELNIDRIVVHGLPLENTQELNIAIQNELTRLITEQGIPANWSKEINISHLRFDAIQVPTHPKPMKMGAQIAQSVYTGFKQPKPVKE